MCTLKKNEIEVNITNIREKYAKTVRTMVNWLQQTMLWLLCLCLVYIDCRSSKVYFRFVETEC